jgi:site-specific DNA-methyltransferase (adenine-specific)
LSHDPHTDQRAAECTQPGGAAVIELLNMDCMDYLRDCPDKAFDLAVVDPPYGLLRLSVEENRDPNSKFRRSMSKMVDSAKKWNAIKPTDEYFSELFRVSSEQIVWGANNFTLPESEYFCVWDKMQTVDNFASAEYAWVSMNQWKKPAKVFRYQIHAANAAQVKIHPTQKPIKLYNWILTNYAKPGQRILDTHLGSGSSAIAAHYFGCDFVGIELDEDYYKAAVARFDMETRQVALL